MTRTITALFSAIALFLAGCASNGSSTHGPFGWCKENPTLCVVAGVVIAGAATAIIVAAADDDDTPATAPPPLISDSRLKTSVQHIGTLPSGLALYTWQYLGGQERYAGVMADDVLKRPDLAHAVHQNDDGIYAVNYAALGLTVSNAHLMRAAGERAFRHYRAH